MSEERPYPMTKLSAGDKKLTELFVERAKQGDKYKCWGCGQVFDTPEGFIEHFQTHIDSFFKGEP